MAGALRTSVLVHLHARNVVALISGPNVYQGGGEAGERVRWADGDERLERESYLFQRPFPGCLKSESISSTPPAPPPPPEIISFGVTQAVEQREREREK